MKVAVTVKMKYEILSSSSVILSILPFKSDAQTVWDEAFQAVPGVTMQEVPAAAGEKRMKIIDVPDAGTVSFSFSAKVENIMKTIPAEQLVDVAIPLMPASVLRYLHPSRYCQSDRLYKFAYHKFGHLYHGFDKVMAVRDWIHENVEYSGGFTTPHTSAFDTITEQVGVCRDFAHLGVALCRALTIPARYVTAYSYQLQPQDFHACFEAYLGGHWILVDATKMAPLNGMVKIASGADATETAFASTFGNLQFQDHEVNVTLLDSDFEAVDSDSTLQGYSFS
ncbi:transglutaminase-like domain-containing protein [Rufibacter hautae]|uniref:Transglutaminase family protein n=1 Tax=Rufibacter hautae TaxID=2595005 RepID=A0A5B6TB30_9BACT|nr:transglutaminase family protein [Rufibacter hautae]KAA3436181.1 transglutaminase family protein [Rufibacter hautae]